MQPDLEKIAVAWAKADSAIAAINAGRAATRLPKDWTSNFLRIVLVDGSVLVHESSDLVSGVLQFDAYAKSSGRSPNYSAASELARTVEERTYVAAELEVAGVGSLVSFGIPTIPRRIEEAETGFARYLLECSMVARALV